ncbi:MAG: hypothetical protein WCG73_00405 [Candidatus Moraniibacteriota bacterium]
MTKNSRLIVQAAEDLGLTVEIISEKDHLFIIHNQDTSMLLCELFSMTLDPNSETYRLSKNKDLTYALWERAGIPFPKYYHFKNLADFQEKISHVKLIFPLITKEGGGSKSINVHMDIRSKEQLNQAAQSYKEKFIVQKMVTGKEYRLLIYKGRLLGALQMIPPQIKGDGARSIQALISEINLTKEKKIKLNTSVLATIKKSGYTEDSVPQHNEIVMLQKNSCLAEGGESLDCTELVHPEIITLAWKAVQATNLRLGGVDLICDDITIPIKDQALTFLEVNTYPDLKIHYSPTKGKSRPVAKMILEDIFKRVH